MRLVVTSALLGLLAAGCGGSEPGSEEDLAAQLDALNVPSSMTELDDIYVAECPSSCPSYVRWYDTTAPPDPLRVELQSRMEASGVVVNEASAGPTIFAARNDTHIFFVMLDAGMIADNPNAPEGADVEISVQLLQEP